MSHAYNYLFLVYDRHETLVGMRGDYQVPTSHAGMEVYMREFLERRNLPLDSIYSSAGTFYNSWVADKKGNYYRWALYWTRVL